MGNGSKSGLYYSLIRDNSSDVAAACMLRISKFSARWISTLGLSIGIDDVTAFCDFNLAPLALRRDIAMLGLIHRTVLGQAPSHFQRWFYMEHNGNRRSSRSRGQASRLHEYRDGTQLNIVKRSALGLCSIYNLLPESIVEDKSVKGFQRSLQDLARECARKGFPDWQYLYSTRHMLHIHPVRRI